MSEDYRVKRRSNQQVRESAYRTKKAYGVANHRPVNIIRCLEMGWIETEQGRKELIYEVLDDEEMGGDDARTEFSERVVTIKTKRSVDQTARFGVGRARMTLAHELGHAVMHPGAPKSRRTDAAGPTVLSRINASESAEHHAKVFASAFLIDDKVAATLGSPEEIATEFVVSLEAAEIVFERLVEEAEHAKSAERVEIANKLFQAEIREKPLIKYVEGRCSTCTQETLIPIGIKYLCMTCDAVSDQLQDGDEAG